MYWFSEHRVNPNLAISVKINMNLGLGMSKFPLFLPINNLHGDVDGAPQTLRNTIILALFCRCLTKKNYKTEIYPPKKKKYQLTISIADKRSTRSRKKRRRNIKGTYFSSFWNIVLAFFTYKILKSNLNYFFHNY